MPLRGGVGGGDTPTPAYRCNSSPPGLTSVIESRRRTPPSRGDPTRWAVYNPRSAISARARVERGGARVSAHRGRRCNAARTSARTDRALIARPPRRDAARRRRSTPFSASANAAKPPSATPANAAPPRERWQTPRVLSPRTFVRQSRVLALVGSREASPREPGRRVRRGRKTDARGGPDERRARGMHQRELVRVRVAREETPPETARPRAHERERRAPRQDNYEKRGRREDEAGTRRRFVASRSEYESAPSSRPRASRRPRRRRPASPPKPAEAASATEFRQTAAGGASTPALVGSPRGGRGCCPGRAGRAALAVAGGEIVDVGVRAVGVFLVPHVIFVSVVPPRGAPATSSEYESPRRPPSPPPRVLESPPPPRAPPPRRRPPSRSARSNPSTTRVHPSRSGSNSRWSTSEDPGKTRARGRSRRRAASAAAFARDAKRVPRDAASTAVTAAATASAKSDAPTPRTPSFAPSRRRSRRGPASSFAPRTPSFAPRFVVAANALSTVTSASSPSHATTHATVAHLAPSATSRSGRKKCPPNTALLRSISGQSPGAVRARRGIVRLARAEIDASPRAARPNAPSRLIRADPAAAAPLGSNATGPRRPIAVAADV